MHTAYQRAVSVLGNTLALMTRDQRGVACVHKTDTATPAIAESRFIARPHL